MRFFFYFSFKFYFILSWGEVARAESRYKGMAGEMNGIEVHDVKSTKKSKEIKFENPYYCKIQICKHAGFKNEYY